MNNSTVINPHNAQNTEENHAPNQSNNAPASQGTTKQSAIEDGNGKAKEGKFGSMESGKCETVIELRNASFSWDVEGNNFMLKDLSFTVEKGRQYFND